ncbi:MAG TPA: hypothetical protein VNM66_05565, partial [Thermodesulfobacteriota bacterium]|nr:hypothetical protein [Thermodesulfobacteriota bacterium]
MSAPPEGGLDLKELRALFKLMAEADIAELELDREGERIRIRRAVGQPAAAPAPVVPPPASAVAPAVP